MLHLIRHGETDQNARRVLQLPDVPLSARGRAQAARLAARLAGTGIARILASDLARAAETAAILAEVTGAPVEHEPLLHERNFGVLRGTPYAELETDPFAAEYEQPDGESQPVFFARVDRAWLRVRELAAETEGPLAVVTHGLVCHGFLGRHMELDEAPPQRIDNTALTLAEPGTTETARWRVRLLACTAHLSESESGDVP